MTTNNQADYVAILKGLQLLQEVNAELIEIFRDSQLVINQLIGLYECKDDILREYYDECRKLLEEFPLISLQHIPRAPNQEANQLAQNASGYQVFQEVLSNETLANDWRVEIANYLKNPSQKVT
jgi:ribonuclease HI